jgi:quercetin dioxygenase-like cupin family protein
MRAAPARLAAVWIGVAALAACRAGGSHANPVARPEGAPSVSEGMLLGTMEGEARFLGLERVPTLIKVDSATVGAAELFVFQRTLDPGASFGYHRHVQNDEVIFVHTGELTATVARQARQAPTGATIFVPAGAWMNLENRSAAPAVVLIVFAAPHMARYIRALGTPAGVPQRALTDSLLQALAARHHVEFATP